MSNLVKVKRNIWGNYGLFIGREKVGDTGEEWFAKNWLSTKLKAGCNLSVQSDITQADIDAFNKKLGIE